MLFYHVSFFFVLIDWYLLIPAVTADVFNPTAKLVISMGIPAKEAKTEMETHPVIGETTISKWSI